MVQVLRRMALLCVVTLGLALVTVPPVTAAVTTNVTGTVTGPGGEPLAGQILFCPGPDFSSCGGTNFTDGTFSVDKPEGDYKIRLTIPSMDGLTRYYKTGTPGGVGLIADATVYPLTGTPLVLDPLQFPAIATLAGTVTNGNGDPMPGLTVFRNRLGSITSTTTDGAGQYDFGYVQAGTLNVTVNGSGAWAGAQQSVSVPASGAVTLDLVMPAAAHIAGTLTDQAGGAPIPFLELMVFRQSDHAYQNTVTTDLNGHFDVGGLGAGGFVLRYTDHLGGYPDQFNGGALTVDSASPIVTTPGQTSTYDDALSLKPDPWTDPVRTLGGTVTGDQGQPLADIAVEAVTGDGTVYSWPTDRLGRWAIEAPPGDYLVRYRQGDWQAAYYPSATPWFPEYYPDAWTSTSAVTLTVPATGQLLGVDAELGRSARLDLTVTGPAGTSDLNAGYQIYDAASGAIITTEAPVAYGGPQPSLLLRPGSWKVLVSGRTTRSSNGTPLLRRWYGGGVSLASAPALDLASGADIAGAVSLPGKLRATTRPRVTGKPHPGRKLTATKGAWNLMTGTSFAFRWLRGTRAVGHASSYVVKARDAGKTLTAIVTARNGGLSTTARVEVKIR